MQMDEVLWRQREWKAKGNPPCEHPDCEREYSLGTQTGDYACTQCGAYVDPAELRAKRQPPSQG